MRYVELRRHTDNDGDHLTPEGVAAAEKLAVNPPYAALVSTGAQRATEMLRILRRSAGQDELEIIEDPTLRSAVEDRWRETARVAGKGASLEDLRAVDPDLVDQESRVLGGALRRVFDRLPDGARALVVGHTPTNEAAVLGLVGEMIAPMGKGDGVLIVEDGGRYRARPLD